MYVGHMAIALASKRVRVIVPLAVLIFASQVPDWADAAICIAGGNPSNGIFTHSIPAVLAMAAALAAGYLLARRDWRGALLVGALTVSHMLADYITSVKPTWPGGPYIGLELYDQRVLEFLLESVLTVVGLYMYSRTLPPRRRDWRLLGAALTILLVCQLIANVGIQASPPGRKC